MKVSVSIHADDLVTLRERARRMHGGNLSAAFAEAATWIRQREARRALVDMLGGPLLTPAAAAAIDAEQRGGPRFEPPRRRARRG